MISPDLATEKSLNLVKLAVQFARSAMTGDEDDCFEIYDRALGTGASMVEIYQEFLSAGMTTVGNWYHADTINEVCEHMASEITERLMHRTAFHFGKGPKNGLQALLGGGPESWHVDRASG